MAKYYIKEMRKIQPRGPYLLGGYCMGGVIAFEMAQQLCASGDQIMLLTLFDTLNPVRPPRRSTFMDKVRRALDILSSLPARESLRHFSGLTISRLKIRLALWNEQLQRILIRMKMAKGEPLPTDLAGLHTRIELARACNSYQPRIYPGKITLFFADHPESGFECSEDHGWADFAASGLEIHKVSAGHFNMLGPPNAYLLAQQLDRCIEAALRQEFLASETSGPCRRTAVVKAER
jgi:thioesterase domain-containing protein